jgi:hypothetical protein
MLPLGVVVPAALLALHINSGTTSAPGPPVLAASFGHVQVDAADLAAARAEGEAALIAARTVLKLADVRFDIVEAQATARRFGECSPQGVPIYVWPFRRSPDGRSPPPPAYLLRHEIGHHLFIRYLVPSTRSNQYGGDAPDWLDEMAAVAFEGEPLLSLRRQSVVHAAQHGKLFPLRRFLTMVHPEFAARSIPETGGRLAAFSPASSETASFYAMAAAFYDFLVARTGDAAIVAALGAAARNGERLEAWLLARTGHADLDALDADYRAWIASSARYGAADGQRADHAGASRPR